MTSSSTPATVLPEQKPTVAANIAPDHKTEEQKKADADKAKAATATPKA